MSTTMSMSTQFNFEELTLNGENALELFHNIEIFENIFLAGVTGSLSIIDSDGMSFIEKNEIEFNEEITFKFSNAAGDELKFEGVMNGVRDEITQNTRKIYIIDFSSNPVRKNEMTNVSKAFKNMTPEDIIKEMVEKLESKIDGEVKTEGEQLTWVAGNRKPMDICKYVVNHGVTKEAEYSGGDDAQGKQGGTSGYLFWETLKGHRFSSMDSLSQSEAYESHEGYETRVNQYTEGDVDTKLTNIINYEFPKVGDYFEKLRSGALKTKFTSMNNDTGILTTFNYEADESIATKKQLKYAEGNTRNVFRLFSNERFEPDCKKAQSDTGDQSRKNLTQTIANQNRFSDTQGRVTLPPNFKLHAGDKISLKINKIDNPGNPSKHSEKQSGKYLISQVGHHIFRDGKAYTNLALIRTSNQQNEQTST